MINKNITLLISGEQATLSKPLVIYRYDNGISFNFTITQSQYKFDKNPVDLANEFNAQYSNILIKKPDKSSFTTTMVSITNNTISFVITEDMINDLSELGTYYFQIHLYDKDYNRITTPPVYYKVNDII